eukprot:scaffold32305_cov57-Cyclotella_meneghiniana.AAC.1
MVKRVRNKGFINFYGEQRVGDAGDETYVGVRSFDVGKAMLKEDFSQAIDLIMAGRSNQVYTPCPEEIEAREIWTKTKDARQTLARFPKNASTMARERDLMRGMLRYDNALEAIRCVHHNVRMVATERIRRFGISPVIGDLYIANDIDEKDGASPDVQIVKNLTSIDISQVVLPLPGYNVQYPTNEIGELYESILFEDGVQFVKEKVSEATAKGSYRKLIQSAHELTWETIDGDPVDDSDDHVILNAKLTFELESGSYATMMLRELMVTTMSRDSKVICVGLPLRETSSIRSSSIRSRSRR